MSFMTFKSNIIISTKHLVYKIQRIFLVIQGLTSLKSNKKKKKKKEEEEWTSQFKLAILITTEDYA